jgi:hypothetical protein
VPREEIERLIGKAIIEPEFLRDLLMDPEAAAGKAGIVLSPDEIDAIKQVSREQAMKFAEEFESRIIKRWMGSGTA